MIKCYYLQENKIVVLSSKYEIIEIQKYTNQKFEYYISLPWIDSHTHCNYLNSQINTIPDNIGVKQGVGYLIDSGSTGVNNFATWKKVFASSKTTILPLLNISRQGIVLTGELKDLSNLTPFLEVEKISKQISGFKLRLSPTVTNHHRQCLVWANKLAKQFKKPLQIHIGNKPPKIEFILNNIQENTILTHCFNSKDNNLFRQSQIIKLLKTKITEGLILDVGHGSESFSLNIAKKAIQQKVYPHLISTDAHQKNLVSGPVYSLACTMSKMLFVNQNLKSILDAVTINPQQVFNITNYPKKLKDGFTLFQIINQKMKVSDGQKNKQAQTIEINKIFVPKILKHNNQIFKVSQESLYGKNIKRIKC